MKKSMTLKQAIAEFEKKFKCRKRSQRPPVDESSIKNTLRSLQTSLAIVYGESLEKGDSRKVSILEKLDRSISEYLYS